MSSKITRQQAEKKLAEIKTWLALSQEVDRLRRLKQAQRLYYIEKLAYMDEHNTNEIQLSHAKYN